MIEKLAIDTKLLGRIVDEARRASPNECMGLLASTPHAAIVGDACLLAADASATRAESLPATIARAARVLKAKELAPRGIWHSHGHGAVFHSATDISTINRLLPGMADLNFKAMPSMLTAPAVTAPDEAMLPAEDGQIVTFTLRGQRIIGLDATELVSWEAVATRFLSSDQAPSATFDSNQLGLRAGRVALDLSVPEGASITWRKIPPPVRMARLYSLVVNVHAERFAECLTVYDVAGESFTRRLPCDVEAVEGSAGAEPTIESSDPLIAFLMPSTPPNGSGAHWLQSLVRLGR